MHEYLVLLQEAPLDNQGSLYNHLEALKNQLKLKGVELELDLVLK